jgi:dipeptidyl aminopeptidase/acylaminoacyl peptidase
MQELTIPSSIDGRAEPSLFAPSPTSGDAPLLVGLHTWSADRFNQKKLLPLCQQRGWHLLLPEFRGPNLTTNPRAKEACASNLAQQDILDAVDYVHNHYQISKQVFLLGGSGGGHMSLMMAARAPKLWTAVSAWCPITDLSKWRLQNPNYRAHIEACCGGVPEDGPEVAQQYAQRSPITHIDQIAKAHVYIQHGKNDPSVPCTHTLELYQKLFYAHPDAKVYCDIFPGKHDFHPERAMQWVQSLIDHEPAGTPITR